MWDPRTLCYYFAMSSGHNLCFLIKIVRSTTSLVRGGNEVGLWFCHPAICFLTSLIIWTPVGLVHWNPTDLWVDFTSFDRNLWGSSPQWDHFLFKIQPSVLIWASAFLYVGNLTIYWPVCKPFRGQDEVGCMALVFSILRLSFVIMEFEFGWPGSSRSVQKPHTTK